VQCCAQEEDSSLTFARAAAASPEPQHALQPQPGALHTAPQPAATAPAAAGSPGSDGPAVFGSPAAGEAPPMSADTGTPRSQGAAEAAAAGENCRQEVTAVGRASAQVSPSHMPCRLAVALHPPGHLDTAGAPCHVATHTRFRLPQPAGRRSSMISTGHCDVSDP
jgi:hypothetical protein